MGGVTPLLRIATDREPDKWIPIDAPEFIIGRSRSCHLVLGASQVSRRHCRIFIDDGTYFIEDVGSSGGTFFGKTKLNSPHAIADGSEYSLGDTTIRCELRAPSRSLPPDPRPSLDAPTEETPPADLPGPSESDRDALWACAEPGQWILVRDEDFIIGRSKNSQLRLRSPTVSRAHAKVQKTGGVWTIEDLGSTCGIRRGDETLESGLRRIYDDDDIGVGECHVLFSIRPRSLGPPSDAGQHSLLITTEGEVRRIEGGRISIGTSPDSDYVVSSSLPVSFVLGLGRRAGQWVGLLWNEDDNPDSRRPHVVHDGEAFEVGDAVLRLTLPRALISSTAKSEAKTTETVALRVCYLPGEWTYIEKDEFSIGRSRNSDLPVNCPTVSRTHCKVVRENGDFFIVDAGGAGGLWKGNQLVQDRRQISADDEYRIGDQVLRFEFRT